MSVELFLSYLLMTIDKADSTTKKLKYDEQLFISLFELFFLLILIIYYNQVNKIKMEPQETADEPE